MENDSTLIDTDIKIQESVQEHVVYMMMINLMTYWVVTIQNGYISKGE